MVEGRCCGTCRFHRYDKDAQDWMCTNLDSESFADYTGYEDGVFCQDWKAREQQTISGKLQSEIERRQAAFRNYGR